MIVEKAKGDFDLIFDNRLFRKHGDDLEEVMVCGGHNMTVRHRLVIGDELTALQSTAVDTYIDGRINSSSRTKLIVKDSFPPSENLKRTKGRKKRKAK